ncbi:helix-turn-helix domain-containing protein [Brevibacillus fulvus]|uniref:XRE-type DNA-binding protein n=1 Tax=Brevibacillus fulvus TaxID=1125967 RepID=A0A939BU35_9BACL|nr:helix-turn-helix domain-containing protein [Brevibacillus fulvus]MBM7589096.1 putative XRE-type DNA-binding protein [Brevibacillus fulvus]
MKTSKLFHPDDNSIGLYDFYKNELRKRLNFTIKARQIKQYEMAVYLGLPSSTISKLLTVNKPQLFSLAQLDKLTEMLGFEEGHYYDWFLSELRRKPVKGESSYFDFQKTEQFLQKCVKLSKFSVIKEALRLIVEERWGNLEFVYNFTEKLFDYAEAKYKRLDPTFDSEEYQLCASLYQLIIDTEQFNRSERLAVSHFKLYYLRRNDGKQVHRLFELMLGFVKFLPEKYILEAYERICSYYYINDNFNEVIEYSLKLEELAKAIDEDKYGYSLLIRGLAYKGLGKYQQSLQMIDKYKNIKGFEHHAYINQLEIRFALGDLNVLTEMLRYIRHEDEYKEANLSVIIEHLIRFDMIDMAYNIINEFKENIDANQLKNFHRIKRIITYKKVEGLCYLLKEEYDQGFDSLLFVIEKALEIGVKNIFGEAMVILHKYRKYLREKHEAKINDIFTKISLGDL